MIGRIYKVEVNENDFYIGSTILTLKEREIKHNNALKRNVKYKLYEECRINNITKISCLLIEEKEVENKEEIRQLEQEYITKLQPSLNCNIAYTDLTREEYNKEYHKEWRQNHKEYHKEYYYENKDKVYNKKYYYENKDKISERKTEKIKCPICNSVVSRCNIAIHKKSIKCRSYIECFIQD